MDIIYGIHAVEEALKAGGRAFDHIAVARERHDNKVLRLIDLCKASGIPVRFVPRDHLDRITKNESHQGIAAVAAGKAYSDVDAILDHKKSKFLFVLVLDGIEDPHNLGALIRSADGAGVDGIVIPERRAAGVNATVVKSSAGASEYARIARVTNIARTLDELKAQNVWVVGLDERGRQTYDELDFNIDCALVLGAEGSGLHDLVRKKCDHLVRLPMEGKVASLNVSVAGGVVMYEVARQRRLGSGSPPPALPKKAKSGKGLGS